ncbi:uncharacterized protein LOC107636687 [Arachis ipaensis]|uniref:uncharacterized protein LOC107636687 n=1 Tax=Arachis ipaensis TaxID=130454 RepID=UPI0007AEF0E9|nr:uncharacterized protein LOC107636687 [Arachis ipaensis]XP_025647870.1 uncharacterized protein LOC112742846 [Arachis hypogaea]
MVANAAPNGERQRKFLEEEEIIITVGGEDIQDGISRCEKSLIGRLLADRLFSGGTVEVALQAIWRHPKGFRVTDHGGNLFQFYFDDEMDVTRIERGAPWLFKNFILNLKRWNVHDPITDADFTYVPIWIQFWGLPEHYKTRELGRKIRSAMGEVLDVNLFQVRDTWDMKQGTAENS